MKRTPTIDVKPSADKRTVVITLHSPDADIGVGMMIRMLANYLKHVVESEGLDMKDFAIQPGDKTAVIEPGEDTPDAR